MKPDKKPQAKEATHAKPKEDESKEEFKKRVIKLFRERGLIVDDKKPQRPGGAGGKED